MKSFLGALTRPFRRGIRRLTAPLRADPDYVIPGAQKAGTSSLYNYLAEYPAITTSCVKEPHYFDLFFHRSPRWYRSLFPLRARLRWTGEQGRPARTGEATPYYLYHPCVPERMAEQVPGVRLIVLLRDPVDRAISHFHYETKKGREDRPMTEALDPDAAGLQHEEAALRSGAVDRSWVHQRYSYLERGVYVRQLERYLEHFDADQMKIVQSERFFEDTGEVFREVLEFLDAPVRPDQFPAFAPYNPQDYDPPPPTLAGALREYFRPHNRALFELLGRSFDWE